MRRALAFVLAISFVAPLAVPLTAYADAPSAQDRTKADALKSQADEQMDNLHYTDALNGYTEAYSLTHDPKLLYNMGRAHGALGEYPEAVRDLDQFNKDAPADLKAKVPQLGELITEFKKHVASLTIICNVAGARVLVNNKAVGTTPFSSPLAVNAGPADVEVAADEYSPEKRKITLPGGGNAEARFDLIKSDVAGILVLRATPEATATRVDDKDYGGTPLELSVQPGRHTVLFRRENYIDQTASAVVARSERKVLEVELSKPSVFTRWEFWTVAASVVVIGAATAVILYAGFKEGPADKGDIPPGQIRGPLTF